VQDSRWRAGRSEMVVLIMAVFIAELEGNIKIAGLVADEEPYFAAKLQGEFFEAGEFLIGHDEEARRNP
jgi:hypothetical protein